MNTTTKGRGWAYIGAVLGGVVSIAANVAHSYVPPTGAALDWQPQIGAVVGSVFWPLALFVAVEILARVTWPVGNGWTLLRFGGLLPVAFVAGLVSYRHLSALLTFYGEDTLTAIVGPLAVDGLMVMATGALLATANRNPPATIAPETTTITAPAPAVDHSTADQASAPTHRDDPQPLTDLEPVVEPEPVEPEPVDEPDTLLPELPTHLIPTARFAANNFATQIGRPMLPNELAAAMNLDTLTAGRLLAEINPPAGLNGHRVGAR